MVSSWRRVYIDSNVIIRLIESNDENLLYLIEQATADTCALLTSEFTLAEVLVGPLKSDDEELAKIYEALLTDGDIITIVPVDRVILRRSAIIRAEHGNKGPDAIHVATAFEAGCRMFVSDDTRITMPDNIVRVETTRLTDMDAWPW